MAIRVYLSPVGGEYSEKLTLASGVAFGDVTFPATPRQPVSCLLTLACPADSLFITPSLIVGTLSTTGFSFILSAPTDTDTYELHYSIKY